MGKPRQWRQDLFEQLVNDMEGPETPSLEVQGQLDMSTPMWSRPSQRENFNLEKFRE